MGPAERSAKSPSTPKAGLTSPLSTLLRRRGSGAPSAARRLVLAACALAASAALLAFAATPTFAAVTHPFLFSFTGSETPAGSFGKANGLAVDASSGDVYIADIANDVVDKFDSQGHYLCQITGAGSATTSASECEGAQPGVPGGAFSFANPAALAVDNSAGPGAGDLYVLDRGNGVIDRFDSSGKYLSQITGPFSAGLEGVGVDAGGNVWAYSNGNGNGHVYEFEPSGSQRFEFQTHLGVQPAFAVDSNGNTYPTIAFGVTKFDSAGNVLGQGQLGTIDECGYGCVAVATDLSTDQVYVDEHPAANNSLEEAAVAEYSPASEQLAQFGQAQLASGGSGGIAANPLTGAIYVANATDARVYAYATPGPRVMPQAASEIHAASATANSTVNPEGAELSACRFEYGTDAFYGHSVPCAQSAAQIGSGGSPVAVSAELSGLKGGVTYHFRVFAANPDGTATGADRSFETSPLPVIKEAKATNVSATSADLGAKVNPRGLQVEACDFEYGTEAGDYSLGQLPCEPANLGNGTADVAVARHLEGLSKDTTYHWRLTATNANGTAEGIDHTFIYLTEPQTPPGSCPVNEALRTGPSAALPDCRAYEQVTPTHKNGSLIGDTGFIGQPSKVAASGSRVIASTIQCFAGAQSCNALLRDAVGSPYSFQRTEAGWRTTPLAPPASLFPSVAQWGYSAEAGTALFSMPTPPAGEDDFYKREADGAFVDIGPDTPPADGPLGPQGGNVGAGSSMVTTPDLSHIAWEVSPPEDEVHWPFDDSTGATLYEYAGANNEHPFLVGVGGPNDGPGSTDLISTCRTALGDGDNAPGTMSEDGRTVFFTASTCASGSGENASTPVPADTIYARIDGESPGAHTVAISAPSPSECGAGPEPEEVSCRNAPPADAKFEAASEDGSKAFFTSTRQLTDEASEDSRSADSAFQAGCAQTTGQNGCNLYLYDSSQPAGHHLIDVSAGDTSGGGPRVQGAMAISTDGSHVYFVAKGVLTGPNPEGAEPVNGADNLYAFERDPAHPTGHLAFITALPGSERAEWRQSVGLPANVTPDGRFLVFTSKANLTPDDTSASGATQVFRYDAQGEALTRVSIGQRGFNDNGNRSAPSPCNLNFCSEDAYIVQSASTARPDPAMSDDGSRVFFTSPVGLTPGALDDKSIGANGGTPLYAQNLYEWEAQGKGSCAQAEGCVFLISDGRDASLNLAQEPRCPNAALSGVCLLGVDSSGENAFFATTDSLVPSDTDTELDFYDARVNGGFAEPPQPLICQGDACKGEGTAEGSNPSPGSGTFNGPEEGPNHPRCNQGFVKKHGKCVKVRKHHKKRHHKRAHRRAANANRRASR